MQFASKVVLAGLLAVCASAQAGAPNVFRDPLDAEPRALRLAASGMLSDVTRVAEGRYVAVGRRGLVLVSTDGGGSWQQTLQLPASTDLLSVSFADEQHGWTVGHGGVVLHSADGGLSWTRQIDGRGLADLLIAHYKPAAEAGDEGAQRHLGDAERFKQDGPGRPLLAVHFSDAQNGIAVGAYNLAIRTADGGRSWQVISDLLDNPNGMHLYGIARIDGRLWIAGEQGVLLREEGGRFVAVKTPYPGSFFGVTGRGSEVVVYGLRGNALRSTDGGATWKTLVTGTTSSLTAGALLHDGRLLLAAMSGELLVSSEGGARFSRVEQRRATPWFGLAVDGAGAVITAGATGVRLQALAPAPQAQIAARSAE